MFHDVELRLHLMLLKRLFDLKTLERCLKLFKAVKDFYISSSMIMKTLEVLTSFSLRLFWSQTEYASNFRKILS